jgi:hypothetical protein
MPRFAKAAPELANDYAKQLRRIAVPRRRAEFDAVTTGRMRSPGRREIDTELLKYAPQRLVDEINVLYNNEMSIYVRRMSDGELWRSNGPVFVGEQMEIWINQYERAFRSPSELIQAVAPNSDTVAIAGAIQFRKSP